jgi:hypothetical protein
MGERKIMNHSSFGKRGQVRNLLLRFFFAQHGSPAPARAAEATMRPFGGRRMRLAHL